MWMRKSVTLSVLVMSFNMYGFGSSDLEELQGLIPGYDKHMHIETKYEQGCNRARQNVVFASTFFYTVMLNVSLVLVRDMIEKNNNR